MRRFGPLFTLAAPLLLSATPTELPSGAVWTVGPDGDYLEIQRAVDLGAEGRYLAAIGIGARRRRRRIGVGDVFRDDAHAAGLGAQA